MTCWRLTRRRDLNEGGEQRKKSCCFRKSNRRFFDSTSVGESTTSDERMDALAGMTIDEAEGKKSKIDTVSQENKEWSKGEDLEGCSTRGSAG